MVEPYLSFGGNCAEAIDFYEKVFSGTDKQVMRYKDAPPIPGNVMPAEILERVMHAEMTIAGTHFSFSDNPEAIVPGNNMSLMVRCTDPEDVQRYFAGLKDGGVIKMDLGPQFFARQYAWVVDRFGVHWQLICN
jgi:PhnB protein